MTRSNDSSTLSRRSALGGLGAAGLGVALVGTVRQANAQDAVTDLSSHPLAGTWMAMGNATLPENTPLPVPSVFNTDGSVLFAFTNADIGPDGPVFQSIGVGHWEAYDEHRGHFTVTRSRSAPDGTLIGTITIDGHPLVSEDGLSFSDDGALNTVTIRDRTGAVIKVIPPGSPAGPVNAIKMGIDNPGFPEMPPATPTN